MVQRCVSYSSTNCGSSTDGWLASTTALGTYEESCYYFAKTPALLWDQAWKACWDLSIGSRLAVLETNAEFNWIMSIYITNYSSTGGLYIDATRGRYGGSYMTAAWRGGMSLASGVGVVMNNVSISPSFNGCWAGLGGPQYYNQAFYLTSTGNIVDIFERNNIPNGGYLCKKFRTAPTPVTIGYNLATCFTQPNCPAGWTSFTPNTTPFCYYPVNTYYSSHDEIYRECHQLGADLAYIESITEWANCFNLQGWIYNILELGAERYRYGTNFSWSNGSPVISGQYGIPYGLDQPDDYCNTESALPWVTAYPGFNDITSYVVTPPNPTTINLSGKGVCKRPKCGIRTEDSHEFALPNSINNN